MKLWKRAVFTFAALFVASLRASGFVEPTPDRVDNRVQTDKGLVEGKTSADFKIRIFQGIPYAAPPVGDLRWKAPQPALSWKGVLKATQFGHRPMQGHIWDDMIFHDPGPSEDCLTLNVWTPATAEPFMGSGTTKAGPRLAASTQVKADEKLPVMVWVYGGGFIAGGTSEARQYGENLARKGVVVVTLNYRLGVFGFFAHPELAQEAGGPSGNYGLMDQVAALQWVRKNIAAFGGDPDQVTIFGESAGSFSVSALVASPMAQGLFQRAIGESGALFGAKREPKPLMKAEEEGVQFARSLGALSLKDLRALPAETLLKASLRPDAFDAEADIDGVYLPQGMAAIYAAGKQSHVPLLAGWNAAEGGYQWLLKKDHPTLEDYAKLAKEQFGKQAGTFLKLYSGSTEEEIKRAAGDLAGDQFIAFSTWKWIEAQRATSHQPVYRYEFDDTLPPADGQKESKGAYHSAEIEFVFGDLASKKLPWRPEDWTLSDLMMNYWTNFAKTGDPNGPGLAPWPAYSAKGHFQVMHLSADPKVEPDRHRKRYLFLEKQDSQK
jgi:para-nitrobenzyl esterase